MGYVEAEPYCSHTHKKNTAPLWEKPGFPVLRHAFSISQRGHCCSLLLWEDDMLKGWKHWINNPSHGGIAQFTDYSSPQGGGACFTMCFYSAHILSCVRDFHISHTLVNYNWTVVTQKTNSEHVCFQFGSRGPAKAEADSETSSLSSSPPKTSASPALLSLTPSVCRTAGVAFRGLEGVLCGVRGLYMVYYWKPSKNTVLGQLHISKCLWLFHLNFKITQFMQPRGFFVFFWVFLHMQQPNFLSNWILVHTPRSPVRHINHF